METEAGSQMALETYSRTSPPFLAHQFFPGGGRRDNINGRRHGQFASALCVDPCPTPHSMGPLEHGQYNGNRVDWEVNAWEWDSVLFLAQPSASAPTTFDRTKSSFQGGRNGNHDGYHSAVSNGMGLTLDGSSTSPDHNGSSDHDDPYGGQGRKHPLDDHDNGHTSYSDKAHHFLRDGSSPDEDAESLSLKLGGHSYAYSDDGNGSRNAKRYRSASPGPQFPVCQVDDCKSELNHAKDYHRRHKVCEMHAKAGKALVSRLMQRFCQQCSRFHPLTEFDEGKRSCRRRLAGHNRRRRKNQPDTPTGRGYMGGEENGAGKGAGLVGILNLLSNLQAVSSMGAMSGSVNEQDAVLQYLKKGALLPPPGLENLNAASLANLLNMNGGVVDGGRPDLKPQSSTSNGNAHNVVAGTEALLSALGSTKTTEALSLLLQNSLRGQLTSAILRASETPLVNVGQSNGNTSLPLVSPSTRIPNKELDNSNGGPALYLSSPMTGRSLGDHNLASSSRPNNVHQQVIAENSVHQQDQVQADLRQVQVLPLAVVQKFFPLTQASECRSTANGKFDVNREDDGATESTSDLDAPASMMTFLEAQDARTLQDFATQHSRPLIDLQHPPPQYDMNENSPSGSDQSPSSSYNDWQNRTGRISFKLFNRTPGELPQLLRSQILDWLAHRPSEMESYIRPGCTVLTIFLSMPYLAWEEVKRDLQTSLQVLTASSEIWSVGRIHVQVERRNALIVDGSISVSKPPKILNAPQLVSVRPLAVVAGQKTQIVLSGCNLKHSQARIFCAYQGKYEEKPLVDEQQGNRTSLTSSPETKECDELSINFDGGLPNVVGRAFIEVERQVNGGNALPVIVADGPICAELRTLEIEIEGQGLLGEEKTIGFQPKDIPHQIDVEDFLNELGWLFHRSQILPGVVKLPNFSPYRHKHLLTFAVERDWCAVVNKVLDIVFGLVLASSDPTSAGLGLKEIFGDEISLLHIAVRRKCRPMVELLLAYVPYSGAGDVDLNHLKEICIHGSQHSSIFTPDMHGPEGSTPLHIAASIEGAEGIVDALTSDPNQIGLHAWSTAHNLKGESPLVCALGKGNTSYVQLVRSKIARRDGQVIINIPDERRLRLASNTSKANAGALLCSVEIPSWSKRSPVANTGAGRSLVYPSSCRHLPPTLRGYRGGSMYRPFLVSMVAIAAVCVCACVVMRGLPQIPCVLPAFSWGSLRYGPL